jgi:hypothetical protein
MPRVPRDGARLTVSIIRTRWVPRPGNQQGPPYCATSRAIRECATPRVARYLLSRDDDSFPVPASLHVCSSSTCSTTSGPAGRLPLTSARGGAPATSPPRQATTHRQASRPPQPSLDHGVPPPLALIHHLAWRRRPCRRAPPLTRPTALPPPPSPPAPPSLFSRLQIRACSDSDTLAKKNLFRLRHTLLMKKIFCEPDRSRLRATHRARSAVRYSFRTNNARCWARLNRCWARLNNN